MLSYIIKRLLLMVLTLFGIVVITFVVTRLTPGQPGGMSQNAATQAGVSYDDVIEQNRRNLGLDKPMLLNFDFEDRNTAAEEAVRDFIRKVFFWQRDAERRLRLSSTIAVEPAIHIMDRLAENPQGVDHNFLPEEDTQQQIDPEDALERLLGIMPQLAVHRPDYLGEMTTGEQIAYWKNWWEENRSKFEEENVEAVTSDYLYHEEETEAVVELGPAAIPDLLAALEGAEGNQALRRVLQVLPRLTGHQPDDEAQEEEPEGQLDYWLDWLRTNDSVIADSNFPEGSTPDRVIADFLSDSEEARQVLELGGYAAPYMFEAIDSDDDQVALRANAALSGLTGFSYLRSEEQWEDERAEVVRRWNSLWSRERIRFSEFGPVADAWNVIANTQFGVWMGQVIRFDFGSSYKYSRSVSQLLLERLPVTLLLSGLSIVIGYLIAIPAGIYSAVKRDSLGDRTVTLTLFILYSLPSFWTAQMLLLVFTGGPSPIPGVEWPDLFPTRGLNEEGLDWTTGAPAALVDTAHHLILPLIALTYSSLAFISRQMRSAMLETMGQDYVRTATAKGLSPRVVIFKHVLRNSLIPIITISSGLLSFLIAGSIVIESIFTIQGMGLLSFDAILNRDYPVINAVLFFSAALTLVGILIADLSYAFVDPRISYK